MSNVTRVYLNDGVVHKLEVNHNRFLLGVVQDLVRSLTLLREVTPVRVTIEGTDLPARTVRHLFEQVEAREMQRKAEELESLE